MQVQWDLWEMAEEAAPELGYENALQLFLWSGYYAIAVGKPHTVTAPISRAPLEVQDMFIADLKAARARGETVAGSFFAHLLEDALKRLKIDVPPGVVEAVVRDTIQNRPRKKSRGQELGS